jgi:hypothetical protein
MWSRLSPTNASNRANAGGQAWPASSQTTWPASSQRASLDTLFNAAAGWTLGLQSWLWTGCLLLAGVIAKPAQAQSESPSSPGASIHSPDEVASRIWHQAILQSVWGPSVHCVVRQSIYAFGKQLSGVGDYVRGGQGSGKLKYHLRMPAGDQLNTLLQVSDGQRLLTIEAMGEVQRRTEVDLGKVRQPLIVTNDSLRDPVLAMYLAIGGQAEMLRKVYQQYQWQSVRDGQLGDIEVWWLTGSLAPEPKELRSTAPIDESLLADNSSGLLPTRIEVAIGKPDAAIPFWLYQVEQVRPTEAASPFTSGSELRILTEWATPTPLNPEQIPASLYELPSSNEQLFDQTEQYLPPASRLATVPEGDFTR